MLKRKEFLMLIIIHVFMINITAQNMASDKCRSFYFEYGLYLIKFEDKEKGLTYLLESEIGDDSNYKYMNILQTAIELKKEKEFILGYLYKFLYSVGENVSTEDLSEYPIIIDYIEENQLSDYYISLINKAEVDARTDLDFLFYNKIKNALHIDQINRIRRTKFTEDVDLMIKIDTLNINNLFSFFQNNLIPKVKEGFTLGTAKDRLFIMLLHNSRYPYTSTYNKVIVLSEKLIEYGYLNYYSLHLFHDEHLINQGQKQTFGEGMARWEGDDKLMFPPIENIEKLDSIRASVGMLPFKFEMQTISARTKGREIIPPLGYVFNENWRQFCDCEFLD